MQRTRTWLLPFSWPYSAVVWLRNVLYNKGWLTSEQPEGVKTIVVGNLALGGTGKTPHTDYIISLLNPSKTAILSRGYGRRRKGFQVVQRDATARDVGDEPLLLHSKHPEVVVAVDEDRLQGIARLQQSFPERELILLDDAFQHRRLKGGLNILLTTWQKPFVWDTLLPAGGLRDHKLRARDAHAIVISKTPLDATNAARAELTAKLAYLGRPVYFSHLQYAAPILFAGHPGAHAGTDAQGLDHYAQVLLLSAIADASLFEAEARKHYQVANHFRYRDHHMFSTADLQRVRDFIGSFAPGTTALLTTEKDAVRLKPLINQIQEDICPMYHWAISVNFGEDTESFAKFIKGYAQS